MNMPMPMPGWTPPPMGRPRTRAAGWLGQLRHQLIIAAALAVAALYFGYLRTPKGWLLVALAYAVVGLLGAARAAGRRELVKTLGAYATVAALVVLLLTAPTTAEPTKRTPPRRPAATATTPAERVEAARAKLANLLQQVKTAAEAAQPPTAPPKKR